MAEKPIRPMLPVRHAPNLFSIDIGSISLKDVQQQMEFPFFSLAKNPDLEPRRYEDRHGNSLEIIPSVKGLPTIYDKDFLIYAVSQIMEWLNRGGRASRRLILYASDMLEFANRTKGGKDYKTVEDALLRLFVIWVSVPPQFLFCPRSRHYRIDQVGCHHRAWLSGAGGLRLADVGRCLVSPSCCVTTSPNLKKS